MFSRCFTRFVHRTNVFFAFFVVAGFLAGCGGGAGGGVVSIGPGITETVFALGQEGRVVAVGTQDRCPYAAGSLPKVGHAGAPDTAALAAHSPSLILADQRHEALVDYATEHGVRLVDVPMRNIASIDAGIVRLGEALECPRQAERLRQRIQDQFEKVRGAVQDLPRPEVLIVVGRQRHEVESMHTVNGTAFASELVEAAGGHNICADEEESYFEISGERVAELQPGVIIEFHTERSLSEKQRVDMYNDWRQLEGLDAFKKGTIQFVTWPHALQPGPRAAESARRIALLLHPGASLQDSFD